MKRGPSGWGLAESPATVTSTASIRARWRVARLFETRARKELGLVGIEFFEWLLLETLHELCVPSVEGVTQIALAQHSGVSRQVVSYWMICMAERGVVDRGPDDDPRAWSVMLTERGDVLRRTANERLEAAGLCE